MKPGSLEWRTEVAKAAYECLTPVGPNREAIGALIGKTGYNAPFDAWTVNDVINYVRELGFQPGEATMIPRLISAMEAAGLLIEFKWHEGLGVFGRSFTNRGILSSQCGGDLWLSQAVGPELVIDRYNQVTIQITHRHRDGRGTGLALGPRHILTNRHVVEGLCDRQHLELITTDLTYRWSGQPATTQRSRVHGHSDLDIAVIEIIPDRHHETFAEFSRLPGMVFRNPQLADELYTFGYPNVAGTVDEPITVQPGRVVNPSAVAPAIGGEPEHEIFLFSAVARPGNSGGPIVAGDGRVIGIVVEDAAAYSSSNQAAWYAAKPSAKYPILEAIWKELRQMAARSSGGPKVEEPAAVSKEVEAAPFYRGIPAAEVVRAINDMPTSGIDVALEG